MVGRYGNVGQREGKAQVGTKGKGRWQAGRVGWYGVARGRQAVWGKGKAKVCVKGMLQAVKARQGRGR